MRLTWCLLTRRGNPGEKILKYSKSYANLPERYIQRTSTRLRNFAYGDPAHRDDLDISPIYMHTMDRPWTHKYWRNNRAFQMEHDEDLDHCVVEPIAEEDWMWFLGDRVEITNGKDKGKQGIINFVVQERNWVTVEGLNVKNQIMGEEKDFPGVLRTEPMPYLVTQDLKLVDPSDEKGAEVEWRYTESGERVRISTRTGVEIPIPTSAFSTIDYQSKDSYAENKLLDTNAREAEKVTYTPSLKTFEMDIMEKMGIKEDRIPKRSYFY